LRAMEVLPHPAQHEQVHVLSLFRAVAGEQPFFSIFEGLKGLQ
jgi:hypothetical protein